MKKLMILAFLFVIVIGSVNVAAAQGKNDLIGNWKYEVPSAPYGYEKGTLSFTEKEGKLVGEVKFADGYKIDMKDVKIEDGGVVKCGLYVDYEYVSVKAKIEGTKMTGTANTPDGELKLTAEKQK
jgi:hypothetical protein